MNDILVGIIGNNKLFSQGIKALLEKYKDISICGVFNNYENLIEKLKTFDAQVLIYYIEKNANQHYLNIGRITRDCPHLRVLIITLEIEKMFLARSFKSGAKGILAKDADAAELAESIYTLRNGFDYYSKSISSLVVSNFVKDKEHHYSDINVEKLSSRELEILKLWGDGKSNKDIADELFISVRTVESHKNHIMQKTNLNSTVDLIKFGIKNNIINL